MMMTMMMMLYRSGFSVTCSSLQLIQHSFIELSQCHSEVCDLQLCKNRLDLKSLQVHSPCPASCRVV